MTVARAARSKSVTLDETVLLPGEGAILAPQWLPWSERLQPGDIGVGDLLPTAPDDARLVPAFAAEPDEAPEPLRDPAPQPAADAAPADPQRDMLPLIGFELGLGRARVLSREGRELAAERWTESHGAGTPMAQAAPARCGSCGFLAGLTGALSQAFGVCANEYSPADGHVVALDFGCGGHSEAVVEPEVNEVGEPIVDEFAFDEMQLHREPVAADVAAAAVAVEADEAAQAEEPAGEPETALEAVAAQLELEGAVVEAEEAAEAMAEDVLVAAVEAEAEDAEADDEAEAEDEAEVEVEVEQIAEVEAEAETETEIETETEAEEQAEAELAADVAADWTQDALSDDYPPALPLSAEVEDAEAEDADGAGQGDPAGPSYLEVTLDAVLDEAAEQTAAAEPKVQPEAAAEFEAGAKAEVQARRQLPRLRKKPGPRQKPRPRPRQRQRQRQRLKRRPRLWLRLSKRSKLKPSWRSSRSRRPKRRRSGRPKRRLKPRLRSKLRPRPRASRRPRPSRKPRPRPRFTRKTIPRPLRKPTRETAVEADPDSPSGDASGEGRFRSRFRWF